MEERKMLAKRQNKSWPTLILVAVTCTVLSLSLQFTVGLKPAYATNTYDYASSSETLQVYYSGTVSFVPSYKTTANSGYSLKKGEHVKRAYLNYTRGGTSVIGGRKWTSTANKATSSNRFTATASCWDNLIDWSTGATTEFHYGWRYF
jgi:hypothetical protein